MSEDWPDHLPDTIPGEGVVREVELLQVPKDWHYSDKCLVVQLTVREIQDLITVCGEEIVFCLQIRYSGFNRRRISLNTLGLHDKNILKESKDNFLQFLVNT